jgi:hypothetical protein
MITLGAFGTLPTGSGTATDAAFLKRSQAITSALMFSFPTLLPMPLRKIAYARWIGMREQSPGVFAEMTDVPANDDTDVKDLWA